MSCENQEKKDVSAVIVLILLQIAIFVLAVF